MNIKRKTAKTLSVLLAMTAITAGCASAKTVKSANLLENVKPNAANITEPDDVEALCASTMDFYTKLFQKSFDGKSNTLVSPSSVMFALGMTANGADGETLSQLEAAMGLPIDKLNRFLKWYSDTLTADGGKLKLADAIWFRDGFEPNSDFLQKTADYYDASLYSAKFDEQTLKDINRWVSGQTDKMIPKILDKIDENTVMYLLNALSFDAEWSDPYDAEHLNVGIFHNLDGSKSNPTFMYGNESMYIETNNASGFVKPYKNSDFAFAVLLPNHGKNLADMIDTLDGEMLRSALKNQKQTEVITAMPSFEADFDTELSKVLSDVGIENAFTDAADFSKMGKSASGLYISRVLHKTHIAVNDRGTKAAAVTAVALDEGAAEFSEAKYVTLDRPFVYMLIDTKTNLPFFIGTVTTLE